MLMYLSLLYEQSMNWHSLERVHVEGETDQFTLPHLIITTATPAFRIVMIIYILFKKYT